MENPRNWIDIDETAQTFLTRVSVERPSLNIPPLHRVPLRVGNVVEIVGTSPSCKSEILLQAAVNCILPREWGGVRFGGLERLVFYYDLDCRFDVVRLSSVLKLRIEGAYGFKKLDSNNAQTNKAFDEELFISCMKRFIYIRCYSTIEFLSALKNMCVQIQKEREAHDICMHFIMIDNIGAFHWIDRACHPLTHSDNRRRRTLSLQTCTETIVQEIRNLLKVQPFLLLATKANIFSAGTSTYDDAARASGKRSAENLEQFGAAKEGEKLLYRDYMPSVWQSLVTHRIHLGVSASIEGCYTAKWIQPALNIVDQFTVDDNGISLIS